MSQRLPSLPSNRAFVVEFRLPSKDRPMMWEGRVEHVVSGQAQCFQGCLHRGRIKGDTPHPTT
jgi:hypothetical protein